MRHRSEEMSSSGKWQRKMLEKQKLAAGMRDEGEKRDRYHRI
ncbi:Hypothetical protein ABZS17I87_03567 [Kosakonia cowanii]